MKRMNALRHLERIFERFLWKTGKGDPRITAEDRRIISRVRAGNLTYLSERKLASVAGTCRDMERGGVQGLFIEAGCALGGSSIVIANAKSRERKFRIYDVFGMIPSPTSEDTPEVHARYRTISDGKSVGIGGNRYYGYEKNLYDMVQDNLRTFGIGLEDHSVTLTKGLLQQTMSIEEPVAFAHIDVDWYDPVLTCLQRVFPKLAIGGSIILDDYQDWGGCRKATDHFLEGVADQVSIDDSAGARKITRVRDQAGLRTAGPAQ